MTSVGDVKELEGKRFALNIEKLGNIPLVKAQRSHCQVIEFKIALYGNVNKTLTNPFVFQEFAA